MKITQKTLQENLLYNPETGEFTRARANNRRYPKGQLAGYKDSNGYVYIWIGGKNYLAHRLAWLYMTGVWPTDQIDHINHVYDDNRFANLRHVTPQENQRNMGLFKKNTTGVAGVRWLKGDKVWRVQIGISGNAAYLGKTRDFFEAVCLRKSAELTHGYHKNHGRTY